MSFEQERRLVGEHLSSKAFVVVCYSILEKVLLSACGNISTNKKSDYGNFSKMIDYISSTSKINIRTVKNYNEINFWKHIRNCIVHNNGITNVYFKKNQHLFVKYNLDNSLFFDLNHALKMCDTAEAFLDDLYDKLEDKWVYDKGMERFLKEWQR